MLLRRLAPPGRAVWLGLALAVLAPAPARAVLPPASSETLLSTCPDARSLRAALTRLADSTRATSASAIGDVHYWRGVSYSRGGIPDSALADFRRAADVRGDPADQIALADALIARSAPGDLEAVAARMEQASAGGLSEDVHSLRARLGWALFLEGRADSAMRVFEPMRESGRAGFAGRGPGTRSGGAIRGPRDRAARRDRARRRRGADGSRIARRPPDALDR